MSGWQAVLLAATGVHLGFQATVTLLVYPALLTDASPHWHAAHDVHSRRITPVVAVVYAAVVVCCVGAVVAAPSPAVWVAVVATATVLGVTALLAAPLHGRLARGRRPELVRRLLTVDRLRLAGAVVALVAAGLAAVGGL